MKISKRVKDMQESPIRKLLSYAEDAKSRGIHVYHLNIGQPDIETPPVMYEAIKNYSERVLAYGPSQGLKVARETVADYLKDYGYNIEPDDVFITTGGSEAIIFAFMAICNPGDEIIIPEPFYTNYNGFASMADVNIRPLTTDVENGFHLPERDEIVKLINEKTSGILICNPNNPTGTVLSRDEIDMLADIAVEHDLYLLADEVYREFIFDGRKHVSLLHYDNLKERVIVMDSISKRFSACGARIGNIVTRNRQLMKGILKLGQARLCPPTIEQIGMIEAYRHMDTFMDDMISEYEKRRNIVFSEIEHIEGAFTRKPEGAFYTVVKLPVDSADTFAKWMLTNFEKDGKTVMIAPAAGFYASKGKGEDEIRIAYVLNTNDLKDAVSILAEGIEQYNKEQNNG